jgi:hypothetical protein
MKSPHDQRPDDQARADTERFIAKYSRRADRPASTRRGSAVTASR